MHYGGRALVRALELDDHELFIAGEDFQTRRLDPRAFSIRFVETDRDIHDIRERDEAENRKHEVKVLFRESTAWRPCATRRPCMSASGMYRIDSRLSKRSREFFVNVAGRY